MSAKTIKLTAHATLFIIAFVVFYLGLGVGLQISATWGTILWGVAIALAVLNILWIIRWPLQREPRDAPGQD